MIREFNIEDIDRVMQLWLKGNISAHRFIEESYWADNFVVVKEMIPAAKVFVAENNGEICGFIGLAEGYIAGIFVDIEMHSRGIGKELLDVAKIKNNELTLHVYEKNKKAVRFYKREGFAILEREEDAQTGELELLMSWKKQ